MNQRGVTLIELLMVIVISAIAMMALAVPLVAERAFLGSGKAQTESQRDAEMGIRAMAHIARQCQAYQFPSGGVVKFVSSPAGPGACFKGGPLFNKQLLMFDESCVGAGGIATLVLIDGNRSKVEEFTATQVVPNKLVQIHIVVSHQPVVGGPRQEDEVLDTEIFLRNGT